MKKLGIFFIAFLFSCQARAQSTSSNSLIQISGIVVTADSLQPMPYASIIIKNTSRGVISDYFGFFTIVAKMNDTLEFTSLGYRKSSFVVPDTLTDQHYSLIQVLRPDTILLREAVIYPWPTKEQFKEAFKNLRIPDDDLARAQKNLDPAYMNYLADKMPMPGSMNYRAYMQQQSSKFYNAGAVPQTNLLNPLAWAKFIQQVKNGEFKRKYNAYEKGDE